MNLIHETERLYLKVLDSTWAEAVCAFYFNNRIYFEPVEPPRVPNFYSKEYQESTLSYEYNEFIRGNYIRLYLFNKKEPTKIIGSICFNQIKRGCFFTCLLGYKTDYAHLNQGYMTEALDYSIHRIVFDQYYIHRIEALVLPENGASIHVLEKLGFQLEGIARDYARLEGIWKDHLRYSILAYQ